MILRLKSPNRTNNYKTQSLDSKQWKKQGLWVCCIFDCKAIFVSYACLLTKFIIRTQKTKLTLLIKKKYYNTQFLTSPNKKFIEDFIQKLHFHLNSVLLKSLQGSSKMFSPDTFLTFKSQLKKKQTTGHEAYLLTIISL